MDRMMDQFMFYKTNIIFCGPASKWRARKKIYQNLMCTAQPSPIQSDWISTCLSLSVFSVGYFFVSIIILVQKKLKSICYWIFTNCAQSGCFCFAFCVFSVPFMECNSHLISIGLIECKQLQSTQHTHTTTHKQAAQQMPNCLSSFSVIPFGINRFDTIFDQLKTT